MYALTTGKCNIAIGTGALQASTTGCVNLAMGESAMGACTATGIRNVAIGADAMQNLTTGFQNTTLGNGAGRIITTGCCNTLIGAFAGCNSEVSTQTGTNVIALGGHTAANFFVSVALSNPSDKRDKTDVTDLDLGLDYIKALRPVYYRWDKRSYYDDSGKPNGTADELDTFLNYEPDGSKKRHRWEIGLMAQEVLAVEKLHTNKSQVINEGIDEVCNEGLTVEGTHNKGYQMQYQKLIMPLIKSTQELDDKIVALTTRVTSLED